MAGPGEEKAPAAAIACMFSPFGTVLGVFTIVVLSRDSVKGIFERGGATTTIAPAG